MAHRERMRRGSGKSSSISSPYISGGCRPASQICLVAQWYAKSAALPKTTPDKVAATYNDTSTLFPFHTDDLPSSMQHQDARQL